MPLAPALALLFAVVGHALPYAARPVTAQEITAQEITAREGALRLGGYVQAQIQLSSAEGSASDLFFRRVRPRLDVRINDLVDGRIEMDLAGSRVDGRDFWVRLSFSERFRLKMGQAKRPFSAFELASSSDLPVIERDGRIDGVDACAGVGRICSFSRLTESLGFDGRDQGLLVDGSEGRLSWGASITNGEGPNAGDVNDGKSITGRVTADLGRARIGVFGGVHDHLDPFADGDETDFAPAGGVDLEIGEWREGFHALAGVVFGENWRLEEGPGFAAAQLLATYYIPTEATHLAGVEPLVRVSWADPDTGSADDAHLLLTPGVMLYLQGKNGFSLNLDGWLPDEAGRDGEVSLKIQSYLYF